MVTPCIHRVTSPPINQAHGAVGRIRRIKPMEIKVRLDPEDIAFATVLLVELLR
jgi:hypothetical protein